MKLHLTVFLTVYAMLVPQSGPSSSVSPIVVGSFTGLAKANAASVHLILVSDGPSCTVQESRLQPDGTFRLSPVRAGHYRVAVTELPDGFGIKAMTSEGLDLLFNEVQIVTSTPTRILIELAPLEEIRRTQTSVRVGDTLRSTCLLHQVKPEYPKQAKADHIAGDVVLEVRVDKNGYVERVTVVMGNPLLNQAAVSAVRQWRYAPVVFFGTTIPVVTTVVVPFSPN